MPGGRFLSRAGLLLVPLAALVAVFAQPSIRPAAPQARAAQPDKAPTPFELKKGDHICIVGNTLADRMQHDGWVETFLYARHPELDITIRNLGFSGDEVSFRQRSLDFGTPDQWLSASAPIPKPNMIADKSIVPANRFEKAGTKADVIFAFFGYNESWAGEAGLPQFKKDLEAFIKHTLAQKYNGKSAPRLVLFSPIAFEDHKSPNLPTGAAVEGINKNLELYTQAMSEVAKANGVRFVDLFAPMQYAYAHEKTPLTINGVHLNEAGNRKLAEAIDSALSPQSAYAPPAEALLAKLRPAVMDKAFHWYQRYRVTDGFSTYGGRAWLKFVGGQTNYEVVQKELEMLDVMTANRDKVIWEVAKGKEAKVDDSNVPKPVPVATNKPGDGPNGTHLFLSGEEAIKTMKPGKGVKIGLFADEQMFPELANPVQMAWDAKGRLWVAVWPLYPHWRPGEPYNDKLLILEDTNGDGKADKMTVFADGLQNPTGFEFANGGVLVAQAPDLMFLKDTNGDDKADVRERVISGLDTADTHHTSNSFVLDPGGAVYFQEGTFHHSQVEDPYGPVKRLANGGVFRYEPRTQKFDVYVTYGFANPHGHVFDKWGQDIVIDGTGANPFHGPLFSGHLPFPAEARPPAAGVPATHPAERRHGVPLQPALPARLGRQPAWSPTASASSASCGTRSPTTAAASWARSRSRCSPAPTRTSARSTARPARTAPSTSSTGRTRSSATCSTTSATPAATASTAASTRSPTRAANSQSRPRSAARASTNLVKLLAHPEDRVRYRAKIELSTRDSEGSSQVCWCRQKLD